jgi:hypothetical protein
VKVPVAVHYLEEGDITCQADMGFRALERKKIRNKVSGSLMTLSFKDELASSKESMEALIPKSVIY